MFKSAFAQECLEETRVSNSSTDSISAAMLPRERHKLYKSQFAASTHGPLDTISLASEDLHACSASTRPEAEADSLFQTSNRLQNRDLAAQISSSSETRTRAASTLDLSRASELGGAKELFQTSSKMGQDLFQTSDLGTSDFSSSELWPSASPSPFDYSQRYRRGSFDESSSPARTSNQSFLNLHSCMQFSHLKKACEDLELGLSEEDWSALATNLLKHNVRNAALSRDSPVQLGDFLAELQSVREERRQKKVEVEGEEKVEEGELSSKALTARLAAKELETLQVRLECQQIYTENQRLRDEYKQLKQLSSPKKFLELQKEVEHLHWQLNKMENSRKLYELATGQLVTFLEQVSSSLSTSASLRGSQPTLADAGLSTESLLQAKRLGMASLDMARSKSMPGLALADSLLAMQTGPGRRLSAREKRVRRSSSVSKTRVSSTSPLPSLQEQEDPQEEGEEDEKRRRRRVEESEEVGGNRSTDSIRGGGHYQRSHSVSDPLCVSTPKAYKTRLLQRRANVETSEEERSKRGTLTSLSSSSSASPPSTDTSRSGRDEHSSDSIPSLLRARKANTSRSLSSLLSDSKSSVAPLELATPEAKVVMASKASRLLKSVRLMLAREKSYDVSQAEEGKRGRKSGRTAYQHRCSGSPGPCCPPCSQPLAPGPVLRPLARRASSGATTATTRSSSGGATTRATSASVTSGNQRQPASRKSSFGTTGGAGSRQQLVKEERREREGSSAEKEQVGGGGVQQVGSYSKNEHTVRLRRNKAEQERREEVMEEETDVDAVSCSRQLEHLPASEDMALDKEEERVMKQEQERKLKLLQCTPEIQSFPIHKVTVVPERESLRAKLVSSKMVKRSRSFNRIFSYSMLGRSKEYRL